ncbi:MAG: LPS export ABC transporter periplasmic protein LptC [Desulfuromonadales bacterium]|nr:LPS export ABC transporter periplasmic protein LptC [Desulfuromonadales bacterium]MBN2791067.1 LPS export ABC transporter periplasmic protein LptC [Desulfuromonadales bacterium]
MLSLKRLLGVVIVLSVLVLGAVIWNHLNQQGPEEILNLLPNDVDLALEDLHYTQNEDGQRRWTLDADRAEYLRDSSRAKLDAVSLTYYQAGAFGDVTLRAAHGEFDQTTRQLDVWGDVVVVTERKDRLLTERLHYDDIQRQLSNSVPFRFISPRLELTGTGLQLDIDQGRLLVKTDVNALLVPAQGNSID